MKILPKLSEKRKIILLVSLILLSLAIVIALYTQIFRGSAKAAWWDETWLYRKGVEITNSNTGDLTDFQISFTLNTSTLIADGKMQVDCDDLRVTDSSGTLLSHWIEENNPGCNSSETKVWVKVPTVSQGTSATTVYAYYGNSSATNIEDGSNVFPFFDDFNTASLSSSWTATGAYTLANGEITVTTGAVYTNSTVVPNAQNYVYEYRNKWNSPSGSYTGFQIGNTQSTSGNNASSNALVYLLTERDSFSVTSWGADGTTNSYNLIFQNPEYTAAEGAYYIDGFSLDATNINIYHNRTSSSTHTGTWNYAPYLWLGYYEGSNSGTVGIKSMTTDWVLVRKYSENTPTYSLKTEETPDTQIAPPLAYWKFDEEEVDTPYTYPSDGLISYWTLDEESGTGAYLLDQSGNENHATPTGTTYISGVSNGARSFPGSSTSHRVTKSSFSDFPTTSISTSIWLRNTNTNSDGILAYASSSSDNDWLFYTTSNLYIYRGGSIRNTGISLNDGKWHHLVVTWQSSDGQLNVYVDGSLEHSSTLATGSSITQGGTLMLGQEQDSVGGSLSSSQAFRGDLDEVLIYNRILDSTEVQDLYNNSKTVVQDSSNSNDGLAIGPSVVNGASDNALSFDGIDDYVSVNTVAGTHNLNSYTINFWVKGDPQTDKRIYFEGSSSNDTPFFGIGTGYYSSDKLRLFIRDNDGTHRLSVESTETILDGTWKHVSFVDNNGSYSIYINGSLDSSGTYTKNSKSINKAAIGATVRSYNDHFFAGHVDEVKIYDYARNPEQIESDYKHVAIFMGAKAVFGVDGGIDNDIVAEHPFADNMTLYWKFDEGSGTTATDLSGSGNNGTITEAIWVDGGYYGKALSFDGGNDRVYLGSHMGLGISNVTLEAWVNIDSQNENGAIIDIGDGFDGYGMGVGGSSWDNSGNNLILLFDQVRWINTGHTLGTGWKHIIMTLSSESKPSVYVDGELVYSDTGSNPKLPENQTHIGGYYTGSRYLDAIIDEVKIYNIALNDRQVIEAYKHSPVPYGSYWGLPETNDYCVPGDSSACDWPIAEWLFDGKQGTTVSDTSGNSNHGTLAGAIWTKGKSSSGVKFDGIDDYIDLSSTLSNIEGLNTGTISGWFKSSNSSGQHILNISDKDTVDDYVYIGLNNLTSTYSDESFFFAVTRGGATQLSGYVRRGDGYFTDGEWHHFAITSDSNGNKIYIDGSQQSVTYTNGSSTTQEITDINSADTFRLGNRLLSGYDDSYFDGIMDQIRVYNYALTPAQVAWDYNRGKPTGYWKLDECTSTIANDSSGNSTHGSISIGSSGSQTSAGMCTSENTSEAWSNGINGKFNSSLSFDGTDDYISLGNSTFHYPNNFTVSAWVKPNEINVGRVQHIVGTYGRRWGLGEENGNFNFIVYDGSNRYITSPAIANQWSHLTAVKRDSGTGMELYINGVSVASDTITNNVSYASGETRIGIDHYQYPNRGFNGLIDEVRIYNYPLTPEQIKLIYNNDASLRF